MIKRITTIQSLPFFTLLAMFCMLSACSEPIEIIFTHGPEDSGTLRQLVHQFNAAHAGDIHVTWKQAARLSNEYYSELEKSFESGTSEIDVLSADVVWTATFSERNWVKNLSDPFFEDYQAGIFVPEALNSVSYQNEVWGVPWYTDLGILYYRKDLLEKFGFTSPPATWTDLAIMAHTIKDVNFTKYGYVFQGGNYEGGVANACEFIWNAGGEVLLGDFSINDEAAQAPLLMINSQEAIQGIEDAQNLVAGGVAPSNVYEYKEAEALKAFENGDAIFMRAWPGAYHRIVSKETPIHPADIGVAALPVSKKGNRSYSCLGGWNLMVSAFASEEEQEAAWVFIQYLTDEMQQRTLALQGGNLPSLRALYTDEALIAQVPAMGLANQVMPNARLRPVTPRYMELAPDIGWAFSESLQEHLSAVAAVETIEGLFRATTVVSSE
jgi:multiple sugar transport system substrate-binding protein